MTSILDVSDRIARFTDGNSQTHFWRKIANAAHAGAVAGRGLSFWLFTGKPGTGGIPTVAAVPTRATVGAMGLINPSGGRQKWLMSVTLWSNQDGVYFLYDRIWHCGGFSCSSTALQSPSGSATPLTRYTNGIGNRMYIEHYVAPSQTNTTTATVNYVNQAGAAAVTTVQILDNTNVGQGIGGFLRVPFADGDTGVQSFTSLQLSNSMGATAGNFGITIAHQLYELPCITPSPAYIGSSAVAILEDVEILTDACLALAGNQGQAFASPNALQGCYTVGEK